MLDYADTLTTLTLLCEDPAQRRLVKQAAEGDVLGNALIGAGLGAGGGLLINALRGKKNSSSLKAALIGGLLGGTAGAGYGHLKPVIAGEKSFIADKDSTMVPDPDNRSQEIPISELPARVEERKRQEANAWTFGNIIRSIGKSDLVTPALATGGIIGGKYVFTGIGNKLPSLKPFLDQRSTAVAAGIGLNYTAGKDIFKRWNRYASATAERDRLGYNK